MSPPRRLITAGCLAVALGACALAGTQTEATAQPPRPEGKDAPPPPKDGEFKKDGPGKKDKGPKAKDKGPKSKGGPEDGPKGKDGPKHVADLRRAYDLLSEASALTRPEGPGDQKKEKLDPADDGRRLLDAAKRVYRDAVKANDGDGSPTPELAAAAHDAARGLKHYLAASRPAAPDLPRPPAGPGEVSEPARADLRRAKDRLGAPADGPGGKEFAEASRKAYDAAVSAFDAKEYERASELAKAAEAWSHVGEHLARPVAPPPTPKDGPPRKPPEPKGGKPTPPPGE